MDLKAYQEGQLLIRAIIHEYRTLFEALENPQILVNGELDELFKAAEQKQNLTLSPLSSIVTLSRKLSKLQECYNMCLERNHVEVKKVQKKQSSLKRLNGEMQELVWEIDKMKRM